MHQNTDYFFVFSNLEPLNGAWAGSERTEEGNYTSEPKMVQARTGFEPKRNRKLEYKFEKPENSAISFGGTELAIFIGRGCGIRNRRAVKKTVTRKSRKLREAAELKERK